MINCGIYRIECLVNHRMYFGSSCDLKTRLTKHKRHLTKGDHVNKHLQADWNLYGSDAFEFEVLIRHDLSKWKLLELENIFISTYWDDQKQCYNVAKDARAPMRGRKASDESREKVAASLKGRVKSPEECKRISEGKKGWNPSLETRARMADSKRGKVGAKRSPETKARMSAAQYLLQAKKKAA